ncbi:MAG: diguanylate cyclase [bacterium]|nr:diguanylate cyclase [bacterium]
MYIFLGANIIYSITCLISSILLSALASLISVQYKDRPYIRPLCLLAIFAVIYSFGYAFEIMKGDVDWVFFWLRIEYLGIPFIGTSYLWFALEFTGNRKYIKPYLLLFFFGISAFISISVFTNKFHNLYYSYIKIDNTGPFPSANLGRGPFYIINMIWFLISTSISFLLFILYYVKLPSILRRQVITVIIGSLFTIVSSIAYFSGLIPWNIDIGPLITSVNGIIFAIGILILKIFNVSPIIRDRIFESMRDGVIVTNLYGIVVDFNPIAQEFIPSLSRNWIGEILSKKMPEFDISLNKASDVVLFSIENKDGEHFYEVKQIPIINNIGKKIGNAWYIRQVTEQKKLLEQLKFYAEKDGLTGIWNRRKWLELAEAEFKRVKRYKRPISIISIDIDHFKNINDTMGHAVGDKILEGLAKFISIQIRESDIFGRVGGEEFAIILPETNRESARIMAERLLKAVANNKFKYDEIEINITVSIGVASYECDAESISLDELIKRGDNALYEAKRQGRNRVCIG